MEISIHSISGVKLKYEYSFIEFVGHKRIKKKSPNNFSELPFLYLGVQATEYAADSFLCNGLLIRIRLGADGGVGGSTSVQKK